MSPTIWRARHAVCLTAALGSIVALPVAAEAATLTTDGGDVLFAAKAGEQNDVDVFLQNDALMIRDNRAPITASGRCRNTAPGTASCGTSGNLFLKIRLGDRNDFAEMTVPKLLAQFQGDDGDDVFFANVKTPPSRAHYHGGFGFDAVDYNGSTGPIRVTLDNDDNDGRLGTNDIDNVGLTTEKIAGSAFGDILTGNDDRNVFEGRAGVDTMIGLGQSDQFEEGPEPNGADSMFGGGGFHDAVSYRQRAGAVKVSLNDRADDGAVNEGDNVDRDVEHITGGAGGDTLSGDQDGNIIDGGGGGRDVIGSGAGGDVIVGILDGAGDDTVGCGGEVDNVQFDVGDIVDADCEFRNGGVGAAQLAPTTVTARPRRPARLSLAWTHPVAWTQLDEVELRLRDRRRTVGRIRLDQETRTVRASGSGLRLHGRGALAGDTAGRMMTGEFALRFSPRLAGRTLAVQASATDDDGTRQSFRTVGRIRVR